MGPEKGFRNKLFRGVHAEALKRGLDHDALHAMVRDRYGVASMSLLTDGQLEAIYRGWTGKTVKRRAELPRRGDAAKGTGERMVSGDELMEFERQCAKRNWGEETRRNFLRRQLDGRDRIRTRRDFARAYNGVRAMNRREGL